MAHRSHWNRSRHRELYDELVAASRPAIEAKGLILDVGFDPALSAVTSNRLKLKQIAIYLLSNATKYTKSGRLNSGSRWRARITGRFACRIPA